MYGCLLMKRMYDFLLMRSIEWFVSCLFLDDRETSFKPVVQVMDVKRLNTPGGGAGIDENNRLVFFC